MLHSVAVDVRKRAVDSREERGDHSRINAGAHRGWGCSCNTVVHQPRFTSRFGTTSPSTSPTTPATSSSASTTTAALGAVAPSLLFGFPCRGVPFFPPVLQVLPASFVQNLEQREVELHELRGEPLPVAVMG